MQIIAQGAESTIYLHENQIIKERISKTYRHKEIDEKLIKRRTKSEVRIIERLTKEGIKVPTLIRNPNFDIKTTICMEYIQGTTLKEVDLTDELLIRLGCFIEKVHLCDVVHGDLTPANILIDKNNEFVLIDFGLSYFSKKEEDKAVDLYVFEKSLTCVFPKNESNSFYSGYKNQHIIAKLEEVRKRGRKREENMIG